MEVPPTAGMVSSDGRSANGARYNAKKGGGHPQKISHPTRSMGRVGT